MKHPLSAVVACIALGPLLAAQDRILIVEKPEARRERDRLEQRLRKLRIDLRLSDEGPTELAERLNLFARDVTMFVVKAHEGDRDYASLKLDLRRVTVANCMSIVQRMSDVRFVFRAGVVVLMHKDDVRELATLRLYDVRAATFKLKDFPGPKIGVRTGEGEGSEEQEETDSENTPSGFTPEKLEEVIRAQVLPESWGGDNGASITVSGGVLIVRQTERGHREVQKLLYQIGVGPRPSGLVPLRARRRGKARPVVGSKPKSKPKTPARK